MLLFLSGTALADEPCVPWLARVVSLEGAVELRRPTDEDFAAARLDQILCEGDTVRVGPLSRAQLALVNDSVLRLDEQTLLQLKGTTPEERSLLDLVMGAVYFFSHRPRALEVDTPFVNAGTEGTEFLLRVGEERAEIVLFEGVVLARNPEGELRLGDGEAAVAEAGLAPRPEIVVRPRDAVAWAIYYPPLTADLAALPLPPALAAAAERVAAGDHAGALAELDRVPQAERDARHQTYRAAVLLDVGRVEAAAEAIEQALALDPAAGEALAQRAVIALARNQPAAALADAREAVRLAPEAGTTFIALSYALQANFALEEARRVLREAVERHPGDALAWARLAEIELALGERRAALASAERAAELAPQLGRTQMVLGFAALARIQIAAARAAFERAIELDPANPLPRLGLGLARIRHSELAAGRHEIEIAAGLDPGDAIIRSYLGKAYFEERRDAPAATELRTAKELDPNDPTPWFYDAIRKQLDNRPVEALGDLETAIALNDNRAIYRSRLLLDRDLATRQVSLARIYDDLGFDQVAVSEASRSLATDPGNHSAHRFLSDSYARLPRHEIARASELLQSQLLQPLNVTPVQPSLAVTDLNVVAGTGPAEAAFNEFHPLFERNRLNLTVSGLLGDGPGNEDTLGNELVVSGLFDRFSFSAGQYHFQTEGFRPNNDQRTDIYNLFGQVEVTPELSLQAEYRYRDTDQGDLDLNFDPDAFGPDNRLGIDQHTGRVGLRYTLAPNADLLASVIYSERTEDRDQTTTFDTPFGPLVSASSTRARDHAWQGEAQYLLRLDPLRVTSGFGSYHIDAEGEASGVVTLPDGTVITQPPAEFEGVVRQQRAYVYGYLDLPRQVTWTLGLGFDSFEDEDLERHEITPKAGVQWRITNGLQLRAAFTRSVKRALTVNQTLEPTQVAGFNQFFDDGNGTRSDRYGIGLDARLARGLYAGVEASRRELDVPTFLTEDGVTTIASVDYKEDLVRTYLYWAPLPDWAFGAEFSWDRFRSEDDFDPNVPIRVRTFEVPVFVRYFAPFGLFAEARATFIDQEVERSAISPLPEGSDSFVVLDAALGYRLPGRRGLLSLEARNLLDEEFNYQDDNFRITEPTSPRYIPARTILGRVTLSF